MRTIASTLSPEKEFEKRKFCRKSICAGGISTIIKYLIVVHGLMMPADFADNLKNAYFEHHPNGKHLSIPYTVIDSIVISCSLWKNYLASEEDFQKLVAIELCSMARIHCSVINEKYVRAYGLMFAEHPPFLMTSIVNLKGGISVYDD